MPIKVLSHRIRHGTTPGTVWCLTRTAYVPRGTGLYFRNAPYKSATETVEQLDMSLVRCTM